MPDGNYVKCSELQPSEDVHIWGDNSAVLLCCFVPSALQELCGQERSLSFLCCLLLPSLGSLGKVLNLQPWIRHEVFAPWRGQQRQHWVEQLCCRTSVLILCQTLSWGCPSAAPSDLLNISLTLPSLEHYPPLRNGDFQPDEWKKKVFLVISDGIYSILSFDYCHILQNVFLWLHHWYC